MPTGQKRAQVDNGPILVGLIPALTRNISIAAQAVRDGASTMLEPGAGLINQNGSINQNPNSFGFALEHLQALGFNLNACLKGSEARAYQIPTDGLKFGPDVYVDKAGQVIAEIQVKAGSSDYVQRIVDSGRYQQPIVTNAENSHIKGTSTVIDVDGIRSIPVSKNVAQMAAEHPHATAMLLEAAANVGEVAGAGISGAAVNAAINAVLESIHQLGPCLRGEKNFDWILLRPVVEQALEGLKSGFIRGAAVKVLQLLMKGNPMAALGFTLAAEALPSIIQLIKGEISLEKAIAQIGPRMLASGVVTVMVLLFPPVGLAFLTASVLQAIWTELAPQEWKAAFQTVIVGTSKAVSAGVREAKRELRHNPLNWLGSSAASVHASSAETDQVNTLLDSLLE